MANQNQSYRTVLTNPSKTENCSTISISTTANTSRNSLNSLGFPSNNSTTRTSSSSSSFYSSSCLDFFIQTGNNNMDNQNESSVDNNYFSSSLTTSTRPTPTTKPPSTHQGAPRNSLPPNQTSMNFHRNLDESKIHNTNTGKSDNYFNRIIQAPLVLTPVGKKRAEKQRSYDQEEMLRRTPLNMHGTFPISSPVFESNRAWHTEEARAQETYINPLLSDVAFSNNIGSTRAIQHKFNDFDLFTNPYLHDQMITSPTTTMSQHQELDIHPRDRQSGTYFTNSVFDNLCKVLSSPSDQNLRQKMPIGFPGLACLHCQGLSRKRNGGRYFPSSLKTLSDSKKTLFAIYKHLQNCDKCPEQHKKDLQTLMSGHEEERRKQRRGSQTSYFVAVWQAIHNGSLPPDLKSKKKSP